MATHSSIVAWRIPGTGEPGGLPSMGSHRVGHDWLDLAAVARRAKTLGCCCSVTQQCLTLVTPWTAAARLPCPSSSPRVCSNLCLLSWWGHPTISSSVISFSSCLQSFPTSGPFLNESAFHSRWPKYWSFNFSISPSNEYSGLISFRMD